MTTGAKKKPDSQNGGCSVASNGLSAETAIERTPTQLMCGIENGHCLPLAFVRERMKPRSSFTRFVIEPKSSPSQPPSLR